MKLYVTSDIHLEFGDLDLENRDNVDVLILSGDICVARDIGRPDPNNIMEGARSNRIRDFFQRCSERFPHTVMVMGNHEHYHGDFSKSRDIIGDMLESAQCHNVYLLEKQTKVIDDYMFIGGTLWTDMNRGDPLTVHAAATMMNDFRGVRNSAKGHAGGNWKFLPEDTVHDHREMKQYIRTVIDNRRAQGERSDRVIVVGHHAPSFASVHEKYQRDSLMNGCYYSDLTEFILDRPEICLWTHGHTHEDFDYMIGTTRVICNPRGYIGYEERAESWQPKLVKL
jgi:Icc-related predicted phosphoesterase